MTVTDAGLAVLQPFPESAAMRYRLARGLDIPPQILGLPPLIDGELAGPVRQVAGPHTLSLAAVCRLPVPGDPDGRRCMLPALHRHSCLPVPPDRGLAVR